MSADDSLLNPYAPTAEVSVPETLPTDETTPPLTLQRTAVRWFTVCGIAALPSFFWGFAMTGGEITGMLLGIFLFAVGYTLIDFRTAAWPIRQKKTIRRTLRFTYGTRIAISVLFPVGGYLDAICGIFSLGLISSVFGESIERLDGMGFRLTLLTTIVQGCLLNIVLAVYGLLVFGVYGLVGALKR